MMPISAETVGLIAATITAVCYIPQTVKIWHLKSARDVSAWTMIQLFVGNVLWWWYGALIDDFPIIISSIVACVILTITFALWYKYKDRCCDSPIIEHHARDHHHEIEAKIDKRTVVVPDTSDIEDF